AGKVADSVDAGHIGAIERIDHDGAAVGFNAKLFEAEMLDVAGDADRGDDALDGERLRAAFAVVDGRSHAVRPLIELRHPGAGQDLDALLLELLARECRNLRILGRENLRQYLDHGHLDAEGAVERGELDADRARTDDQQRLRHALGHDGLEIGPDQLFVGFEAGQHAWPRAGGDDDVLGLIGPGPKRAFRRLGRAGLHRNLARRVDHCLAPDHGDVVLPHQKADAVVEPLRYRARALDHGGGIVSHLLGRETVVVGMLHVMKDLGRAQQRLGGDATPVEADASEIIALDDRGRKTELRRADRGDVAAGPRANDDDIEGGISHAAFSCKGRRSCRRFWVYLTYGVSWAELEQVRVPSPSTSSSNGGFNTCMPGTRPGMVSLDHCRFYAYRPYCITSLSSSTIGLTLAICSRSISRISAWLEPEGSAPTSVIRLRRSACLAAAAIS